MKIEATYKNPELLNLEDVPEGYYWIAKLSTDDEKFPNCEVALVLKIIIDDKSIYLWPATCVQTLCVGDEIVPCLPAKVKIVNDED